MDDKNLKIIRYLAGAIFISMALCLIPDVSYTIDADRLNVVPIFACGYIVYIVGTFLIAFSMFGKFYTLLAVGSAMQALYWVIFIFTGGKFYYKIFVVIAYILLAMAVFQRKKSLTMGIISAISVVLSFVVFQITNYSWWGAIFYSVKSTVCESVGVLLACMVLQNTPQIQTVKIKQPAIAQKTDNRIEELTKLKDLLDTGVISQEEFDAKKKQILGV